MAAAADDDDDDDDRHMSCMRSTAWVNTASVDVGCLVCVAIASARLTWRARPRVSHVKIDVSSLMRSKGEEWCMARAAEASNDARLMLALQLPKEQS